MVTVGWWSARRNSWNTWLLGGAPNAFELVEPVGVPGAAVDFGQLDMHTGRGRLAVKAVKFDDDPAVSCGGIDGHETETGIEVEQAVAETATSRMIGDPVQLADGALQRCQEQLGRAVERIVELPGRLTDRGLVSRIEHDHASRAVGAGQQGAAYGLAHLW